MYHTPITPSGVAGHSSEPSSALAEVPAHLHGTRAAIFFLLSKQAEREAPTAPVHQHDVTGMIAATFVKMMDVKLDFTRPAVASGLALPEFMRKMLASEDEFLFREFA